MKKSLPILFALALALPTKAEIPAQVYDTIDILIQTRSETKIKNELESLADRLGNHDNINTDEEMRYAFELLMSEESQKYITNELFGLPKTIKELSLFQKAKLKFGYPQIGYMMDLIKTYSD